MAMGHLGEDFGLVEDEGLPQLALDAYHNRD